MSHWPSSSSGRSSAASPFFALASGPLLRAPPAILVVLSVLGKKNKKHDFMRNWRHWGHWRCRVEAREDEMVGFRV